MDKLTSDLRALVDDGSLTLMEALSMLNASPAVENETIKTSTSISPDTSRGSLKVGDGSVSVLPPSYESVVVEDAMQDEEDIKNNPTTVIDVLYGHELPQYLETLKSVLTSNNSSLLEIENVLQSAIQQSFSAVNDHRRKKLSQISTRDGQEASKFAMAIVDLTRFDPAQYENSKTNSLIVEIVKMLVEWHRQGWIERFLMNCLGKTIVDFDLNFTFHHAHSSSKQSEVVKKLKVCLRYNEKHSSKKRRQSFSGKNTQKIPKHVESTISDLEKTVIHDLQQRIALLILKQWKELNDHQNINNKKILYATAATSPSNNENTKINKDTPVRIRRRTFLANANQYNVADGSFESDASGGSDNKNGSNRKSSRRNTLSIAPSRMKVQKDKNLSWYALRPPDSTNVVFKTIGPKGANATLKAGASIFSVPKIQTNEDIWTLECNVLANQQIIWEFHAYPASNIDFSLNFSINVDSKVEIFPSTQASNAPNAGSLQQVEGGTYSFQFSSRNIIGYTDIWCVVRCPKAEREDQELRRKYVRASRPVVVSHAFADGKYLASVSPSMRASFSSDSSSQVRLWKRFIGDERITGESPVYIEANGKFLSTSPLQNNKLFFASVKADEASLFYIRGIHPSEELAMNHQFELATIKKDGEYVVCTTLEKVAGESEICLTLVSEARRDGQERKFETARRVTFIASPLTSSRYHGSNDSQDPVFVERRLSNLNSDISGNEWLERAMNLGILDTVSTSAEDEILWVRSMKNLASLKPAVSHRENVEEKKPDKHDDTNAKIGNVIKYIVGMEGGEKVNSLSQRKERLNHILLSVDSISEEFGFLVEDVLSALEFEFENDSILHNDICSCKLAWSEYDKHTLHNQKSLKESIGEWKKNSAILQWRNQVTILSQYFADYDQKLYENVVSISSLRSSASNLDSRASKIAYLTGDLLEDRNVRIAWLQNNVLQEDKAKDRAAVLELIIMIALESKKLNNYKMLLCCHDALISLPILRLGKSWGLVREHFHNEFAMLKVVCSPFENYRTLRRIMSQRDRFVPCFIPLHNAIDHVSRLPFRFGVSESVSGSDTSSHACDSNDSIFNWNKYRLIHDVISQQYESRKRTFKKLNLYFPPKENKGMQAFEENNDAEVNSEKQSSEEILDVATLCFSTILDKRIIMQRSRSLEMIEVGKKNIVKTINDAANGIVSLIVPKQDMFLPYKHKLDFAGVLCHQNTPVFIDIAVETLFCSANKTPLQSFEDRFAKLFIAGSTYNELVRICSETIVTLSDYVMKQYQGELLSGTVDSNTEMYVRKAVAKTLLGRVQQRLWAAVRRDNAIEDEHHMNCVLHIEKHLSDESLWDLCTDSSNDNDSTPFISSWDQAIAMLNYAERSHNPYEKLRCFRQVFQAIELIAKEKLLKPLTADDLMPIVLYVTCRSTLPYKWSTLKYIEPFISIVHSFDGSSSGFDSFCVANFEMAMTIADFYPNFYKKKSVSISRSHSSGSFFGDEEISKADNVGAGIEPFKSATAVLENQHGIDLSANDLASNIVLDNKHDNIALADEHDSNSINNLPNSLEREAIDVESLPFVD